MLHTKLDKTPDELRKGLTAAGLRTAVRLTPRAVRMNRMLVSVLSDGEQAELLRMLSLVVDADERLKRQRQADPGGGHAEHAQAG